MATVFSTNPFGNMYVNLVRNDSTSLAVTANTNMFATDFTLQPTDPVSIFIVYVVAQLAGVLSVRRKTNNIATNKDEKFNFGANLTPDVQYVFGFPVGFNDTINFRYSQTTTLTKFMLIELP